MNDKKNSYSGYLFGIIAIIAAIFFDQYTKLLAVTHLKIKIPSILLKEFFNYII